MAANLSYPAAGFLGELILALRRAGFSDIHCTVKENDAVEVTTRSKAYTIDVTITPLMEEKA